MGKAAGSGAEVISAATVIGIPVVDAQGEDLGRIEEVMIDLESGQVGYAILDLGGSLGVSERLFAIPWKLLQFDSEQMRLHIDVEAEKLRQAPGFDKNNWPRMGDRQWGREIHLYYGQTPYWEEGHVIHPGH
jgi:sporulation protein YlmC with PRC-barrel domain